MTKAFLPLLIAFNAGRLQSDNSAFYCQPSAIGFLPTECPLILITEKLKRFEFLLTHYALDEFLSPQDFVAVKVEYFVCLAKGLRRFVLKKKIVEFFEFTGHELLSDEFIFHEDKQVSIGCFHTKIRFLITYHSLVETTTTFFARAANMVAGGTASYDKCNHYE